MHKKKNLMVMWCNVVKIVRLSRFEERRSPWESQAKIEKVQQIKHGKL